MTALSSKGSSAFNKDLIVYAVGYSNHPLLMSGVVDIGSGTDRRGRSDVSGPSTLHYDLSQHLHLSSLKTLACKEKYQTQTIYLHHGICER